jgi:RNA polymerase sigma-70 factor (ECF subfamily)
MDQMSDALAQMKRRPCEHMPHAPRSATMDDVWCAFLTLMECLLPDARAAYLLHRCFGVGYAQMAPVLGRSALSCRLLVEHTRRQLHELRPR